MDDVAGGPLDPVPVTALPAGTVTFVLGDVVGSTGMWEADPDAAGEAIASLDGMVRKLVHRHEGACPVEQGEGDSFVAAFARASDAAGFALGLQVAIRDAVWPGDQPVAVRVGIHTGDARLADGVYRGETLNRCARIRAVAHGSQVLVSATTAELVVDHLPDGAFLKDLGVHRLRDLQRPESLRQLCHRDLPFDFPVLRSLDRLPNNLPLQVTSFLGRDTEMAEVAALLDEHRVVTLTGAGGSGKTRLALQVAAATLDRYPDGTWLVDLAPLQEPQLVGRTLANILGVHEMPFEDVVTAVTRELGSRRVLAVVDNCEHLLDACATLTQALTAICPGVSVLATSREPVGVPGEHTYRVPSLGLPDEHSSDCVSVQLFLERASAVRKDLVASAANLDAIAAICRRVDGLPLAIELAAARCRSLSPEQIASQLADRFSLVAGGARTSLARQRTLEASVGWSLDLLSDDERSMLLRMSVFTGDFSLDAAEAVSGLPASERWRAIDLIDSLVDKSLLQMEPSTGETRYRLLETVRHIASQRLIATGDAEPARDDHADHYTQLVTGLSSGLTGPGDADATRRLDREFDNIRAAQSWLVQRGNADRAFALTIPLHVHWSRNASVEVLDALERVRALEGGNPAARARLVVTLAEVTWMTGDLDRNAAYIALMDEYIATHDDDELAYLGSQYRGYRGLVLGDPEAEAELADAVIGAHEQGALFWSADAYVGLATLHYFRGALADAAELSAAAVTDARASGNAVRLTHTLVMRAGIVWYLGDPHLATDLLDEAQVHVAERGDAVAGTLLRGFGALIHAAAGEFDRASAEATAAIEDARRAGLVTMLTQPTYAAALASYWSGDADRALVDDAMAISDLVGITWHRAGCRALAAELAIAGGELDDATALIGEAVAIVEHEPAAGLARSAVLLGRSRVARATGRDGEDDARAALRVALDQGYRLGAVEALEALTTWAVDGGRFDDAGRLLGAAGRGRDELGAVVPPVFIAELESAEAAVQAAVGPDRLEQLLAEGATLDVDAAFDYTERGRGARVRATVGWESLTPAERRVVDLVALGLKNADIARQLFVSIPTVKTHLAHVFTKLDITNRAELAAAATRRTADEDSV